MAFHVNALELQGGVVDDATIQYASFKTNFVDYSLASAVLCSVGVITSLSEKLVSLSHAKKEELTTKSVAGFDPRLSGYRGIAAFATVLLHEFYFHFTGSVINIAFPTFFIVGFTNQLYVGVPIFLMLSIYLLVGRLEKGKVKPRNYFKRRIVRIWPIYFGVAALAFFIAPYSQQQLIGILDFSGWLLNRNLPYEIQQFWTLQYEEYVYLVLPLIAALALKNKIYLGYILIVIGAFYMFFSPYLPAIDYLSWHYVPYTGYPNILQQQVPGVLPAYGLGLLVYAGKIRNTNLRWLSIIGLAGMTIFGNFENNVELFYLTVTFYFITIIGFAAVLATPPKFLAWFAILGEESYALYAIHFLMLMLFGILGIVISVLVAFPIELVLRPKEIMKRLKTTYFDSNDDERLIVPPSQAA